MSSSRLVFVPFLMGPDRRPLRLCRPCLEQWATRVDRVSSAIGGFGIEAQVNLRAIVRLRNELVNLLEDHAETDRASPLWGIVKLVDQLPHILRR